MPIRILNTHVDSSYDFKSADTTVYLYHEGPCCIPEYAAGLMSIGKNFIEVFEQEAKRLKNIKWLGQGTIYPDVIESVSFKGGPSVTIKSHHNVGGLKDKMKLKLVEPLRELFKDEVRKLGVSLGLSDKFIGRHPAINS